MWRKKKNDPPPPTEIVAHLPAHLVHGSSLTFANVSAHRQDTVESSAIGHPGCEEENSEIQLSAIPLEQINGGSHDDSSLFHQGNLPNIELMQHSTLIRRSLQRQRDNLDFRTSFTAMSPLPLELLALGDDASFWNIPPRWCVNIYRSVTGSVGDFTDGASPHVSEHYTSDAIQRDNNQAIFPIENADDFDYNWDIPSRSLAAMNDDLSTLGDVATYGLTQSTVNRTKKICKTCILLGLICTCIGLLINVATFYTRGSSGTSWIHSIIVSKLFPTKRSKRYMLMREMLKQISGFTVWDDDMTPQHRALVFLADKDPLSLDPSLSVQLIQRYVLAVIYFATGGASWKRRVYWLTGQHECDWENVRCSTINEHTNFTHHSTALSSDNNRINITNNNEKSGDASLASANLDYSLSNGHIITGLQFYENNLQGSLPMEMTALKYLIVLDLGSNFLEGTIPVIRNFTYLQELYLNSNNFIGTIPRDLATGLTELKILSIPNNHLSSDIPQELFYDLGSLERLNLESNTLTGFLPDSLSNLECLKEVSLGDNLLEGQIGPSLLGSKKMIRSSLTRFDLHGNKFSGKLPASVNAPNLKFLYLYDNILSGTISADLFCKASNNLADIRLNNNSFTGKIPNITCTMKELQLLSLASNGLTGPIPSDLGNLLPQIREIHFFENQLTSTIPENLFHSQSLTALLLGNNALTGTISGSMIDAARNLTHFFVNENALSGNLDSFGSISSHRSLKKLRLEANNFHGQIPVMQFPSLDLLYIFNNSLTGELPDQNWPNMRKLKMSNNKFTGGVSWVTSNSLEFLSLDGNQFHGRVPAAIGELQSLKSLRLERNNLSGTLPIEIKNLTMLEELRLEFNDISGVVPHDVCDLRKSSLQIFGLDCGGQWPEIACSCCTECF